MSEASVAVRIRVTGARLLGPLAPFIGLLVVMGLFHAIAPDKHLTLLGLRTICVNTVIVGVCAMGMTLIIVSGGIDLSVGSAIALVGVVTALVFERSWPLWTGVVLALVAGAACGLYNGLLITVLRLPPFIATLGTLGFYRGLAKWLSNSQPVNAPTFGLEEWVRPVPVYDWLVFAPGVWLMLGLGIVMAVVLRHSLLGRYALAIGSNEATARLCGIRVGRTKLLIYATAGLLTGLAGLMQFARLTQGDPTVAVGVELDVIAAVVIGGGSLAGGQGSVIGTLTGAFLMAYLRNRCTALYWPNYIQEIIVGHIIIIAVALDQWRVRRSSR